jgi:nicotinamidase-related amidase
VFGVVTEYCVRCAVMGLRERGYRVAVVLDAIQALQEDDGRRILDEFVARGARLIQTKEAVALVDVSPRAGTG